MSHMFHIEKKLTGKRAQPQGVNRKFTYVPWYTYQVNTVLLIKVVNFYDSICIFQYNSYDEMQAF